ncbi:unnamed protein product [Schistosoma margrebowiei]|uniref:DUF7041 domain-containing protein n=1 Tax=Schistosoma margrebowiei TaxID=48269 RepID=A0A183MUT5_9TREM|nr:unnamed protein product [Schistosoma margrebowiei]
MPFWPDNIEAWFCYSEANFHEHGMNDTRAQFLTIVKASPLEFNRYVTPSMFTSDVSEPYEILKRSILKRGDLTDRQRLDQLFNNIDLQHGSATDMLRRMREAIGLRTFDEGLFKQLFLSKLPQQVQPVLVSFRNNALDELTASADRILKITKSTTEEWTLDDKIEHSKYIRMFGSVKCGEVIHNEMHFHNELMSVRVTNYLQLKYYYNTIDLRHYCEYLEKIMLNKLHKTD